MYGRRAPLLDADAVDAKHGDAGKDRVQAGNGQIAHEGPRRGAVVATKQDQFLVGIELDAEAGGIVGDDAGFLTTQMTDNFERCRAGVNEYCFVLGDQRCGIAPNRVFLALGHMVLLVEQFLKPNPRSQRRATACAFEQILTGQRVEVAPDGDRRHAEFSGQLVGGNRLALIEHFQNFLVAVIADFHGHRRVSAIGKFGTPDASRRRAEGRTCWRSAKRTLEEIGAYRSEKSPESARILTKIPGRRDGQASAIFKGNSLHRRLKRTVNVPWPSFHHSFLSSTHQSTARSAS